MFIPAAILLCEPLHLTGQKFLLRNISRKVSVFADAVAHLKNTEKGIDHSLVIPVRGLCIMRIEAAKISASHLALPGIAEQAEDKP